MKTVNLTLNELDLEIDFDFVPAEEETRTEPATLESVYIYTIRLSCNGWEQDNIPYKHVTLIKEMLLQRVNYGNIDFNIYSSNDTIYFLRLYLIEVKADMIAMLERNNIKTFFNKIFQNDLVKEMEALALLPLISFNEKNF